MAITCSYNEKVKVSLQVLYCQTSFFGLPGIIVSLIPDTNTNKKINMSTCFNMNIAIYTVAVKQISREYVVFILGIKYKIPRLKSGQNFNPCTGSLILGSSVLGSSVLGLRILSPGIEDPQP